MNFELLFIIIFSDSHILITSILRLHIRIISSLIFFLQLRLITLYLALDFSFLQFIFFFVNFWLLFFRTLRYAECIFSAGRVCQRARDFGKEDEYGKSSVVHGKTRE